MKHTRLPVSAVGLAAVSLLLSTCRADSLFQSRTPDVVITLAGDTVAVLDSVALTPAVTIDGREPSKPLPLRWSSSNPDVASVDSVTGTVRGVARGTTVISVRVAESALGMVAAVDNDTVRVIAASVTLAPGDATMQSVGDTLCYATAVLDAAGGTIAGEAPVLRVLVDPDSTVRVLEGTGCVLARKTGPTATIEAALDTSAVTGTLAVRQHVTSLEIQEEADTLFDVGVNASYPATVKDRRGNLAPFATVAWVTSDTSVVGVDAAGQVTAKGEGTAYVRASADDGADSVRVTVTPPHAPFAPGALTQLRTDNTTVIGVGGRTDETSIVLRAELSDADQDASLVLEIEVRPVGTPFTNTATATSPAVASGQLAFATHTGLVEDTDYHWQAWVRDETNRISSGANFGVNLETELDFRMAIPEDPAAAAGLGQFQSDGVMIIAVGAQATATTVVFKGTLSDPDPGDQLRLEVELKHVGVDFDGTGTVVSPEVATGAEATLTVSGIPDDANYHWRARAVDQAGRTGPWVSFGGNAETQQDFNVPPLAEAPDGPTDPAQYQSDGATAIAVGGIAFQNTVVLKGRLTDADPGDQLTLEVEVRQLGTAFTNAATHSSTAVSSGAIASVTVSGLGEDTDYHWQFRAVDQTAKASAWAGFGANPESAADFQVALPEPPNPPTGLGQFRSNGTTAIGLGATTDEQTVVFKATVGDADPGDQIRLEVEIKPIGAGFDETGTTLGTAVANGAVASVTAGGQADNTSYHWRVRTVDQTNRTSTWISFGGGNPETDTDYRIVVPEPPAAASLAQFKSNGTTAIAGGATTDEATVALQAVISDPDPTDQVRLDLEVLPVAQSFTGTPTHSGALGAGGTVQVSVSGLTDNTDYHWRARARDQTDRVSAWISFGGSDGTTDFRVAVPENPGAPSGLGQFQTDGTTPVGLGATTTENTIVFKATVSDPDPGDQLRLQVEVQPVGTDFTNTASATGTTAVSSGQMASVSVSPLSDNVSYHWQARIIDQLGRTNGWVSFGGNAEAEADFSVSVPGAPDLPTGLEQYLSDGVTLIADGAAITAKSVVIEATVSDTDDPGEQVRLEVEVKPTGSFNGAGTVLSSLGANPRSVQVTVSNLGDDTNYRWRVRTLDQNNNASNWVEFTSSGTNFRVQVPEPPVVGSLAQFKSNGSTGIATGASTDQSTVVLQAAISDPDPTDQVRLELEVRPIGQAFTGTATHSGSLGGGGTVQISVSGLSDNTSYHWRARSRDQSDSLSAWMSFGGNADGVADFQVAVPEPPAAPASLLQFKSNGSTSIAAGASTDEATVRLQATISDPDPGQQVRLDLEVRSILDPFTGTPTHSGALGAGGTVQVSVGSLTDDTDYHWRARTRDATDSVSAWVSFGGSDGTTDFRIAVPQDPFAPASLGQFKSDGTTPITTGAVTDQATVVFKATLTDPDAGAQLKLEVERELVGTDFDGTGTDSSAAVASGVVATLSVAGHAENASYHWRARTRDQTGRVSAWVNFDANAETDPDFRINAVAENPSDPSGPGQFRTNDAAIAIGAVTTETDVVFKATVTDVDPGAQLRIQVERKLISEAFDGNNLATSAGTVSSGQIATVTVSHADNSSHHWRVRTIDETNNTSGWVSFGGNAETAADYRVDTAPEAPDTPTGLDQFQSDGTTQIAVDGNANQTTVVFKATVTDPDPGQLVRLEVELQETGVAFSNTPTATSTPVSSGTAATVTIGGLADNKSYHWQARAIDEANSTSTTWVAFGGNTDPNDADFQIPGVPEPPAAPTALGQFKMDASTAIALNDRTDQDTVVFKATVTDADLNAMVRLEVEVKPIGTAFTGTGTVVGSAAVASGAVAQVTVPNLADNTSYHWRARARDEFDSLGAWVSFGGNAEAEADFHVDQVAQAPAAPTGLGQFKANGTTVIAMGTTTDQNTVVFKAATTDPDPGSQLRLVLEIKPLGTAFDSTGLSISAAVASGQTATVSVGSQADATSYHWRVQTIDQDNNTGAWVSFPESGNAETDIDYRIEVPEPPAAPSSLAQFKSNGSTSIATGASTDESTVVLQAAISDPDPSQQVRLDLEVRPTGQAFTGTPTHSGALGTGGTVQVSVSGLLDDTNFHWRARSRDAVDSVSAWVSFGGNADGVTDFSVAVPQIPNVPNELKQFRAGATDSIPVADTAFTQTVVLRVRLTDPDPAAQVRFHFELLPVGQVFTNVPTDSSGLVNSGDTAVVTFTGLSDNTAYHWQVRAKDQTGRESAWASYGGNNDPSDADFRVWVAQSPDAPTAVTQLKSNGSTTITTGSVTDETTVIFRAGVTDPDPGDSVRLEVELRPLGEGFVGVGVVGALVAAGGTPSVTMTMLTENTGYHWQARSVDKRGNKSLWQSFGGNAESVADFSVNAVASDPSPEPADHNQYRANGTTAIAVGGPAETTLTDATVVFKATAYDSDPGDSLRLEIETRQVGTDFTPAATHTSARVVTGQQASITVTVLRPLFSTSHHWQARICDQTSRCTAWVLFGSNNESAADYVVPGTVSSPPQSRGSL